MPDLSEAQTEAQISDVLTRHGRYPVKTDAALVILGRHLAVSGRAGGNQDRERPAE